MIIPLIPALSLAILSLICSIFVILRIIIPILPPSPLSRRVPPSEFGLPNFRTLSAADKSHVWLASFDILALAIFTWQAVNESLVGPSHSNNALDPVSSATFWVALTLRQTCLFFVAIITLLRVRMGQPVSFGPKHWMLWIPTLLVVIFSTLTATVITRADIPSLFMGLITYSSGTVFLTTMAFVGLIATLSTIKRNLAALNDRLNPWPPVKEMEERPRPSFATEDVDALRDGASWITSNASSRRNSMSAWSFSTRNTVSHHGFARTNPATTSHQSIPAKSSFWFSPATSYSCRQCEVPPVPPLPSPYRSRSTQPFSNYDDPDPFRREIPTPHDHPCFHSSQTSWLTSPSTSQVTLSAWSYPTSLHSGGPDGLSPTNESVRPLTPAFANVQVLGGYGFTTTRSSAESEKGLSSLAVPGIEVDVSVYRALAWLLIIWVPFGLSLPYLIVAYLDVEISSPILPVLLVLSVTTSSPLMALSMLFRCRIPIPSGLFESHSGPPVALLRTPSLGSSIPRLPSGRFSYEYKQGSSVTVVEGRRSDDIWVSNGDAVRGKSKVNRAFGMMVPNPRLAMLPLENETQDGERTPPLPIQSESSSSLAVSGTTEEMSKSKRDSRASSHFSGVDESMDFASRIMIAQRHYSALAQTVLMPDKRESAGASQMLDVASATGVILKETSSRSAHLRTRSVSSISDAQTPTTRCTNMTPPPACPLPPTPSRTRAVRLARLGHKKSFSSGFSFGAVDDVNEIDALTAGVLPLLVPGLKVGADVRIKEDARAPASGKRSKQSANSEMGSLRIPSPQIPSAPLRRKMRTLREERISGRRKKSHFSLPGRGLGNNGVHSSVNWKAELNRALEKIGKSSAANDGHFDLSKRNTVLGTESAGHLQAVDDEYLRPATKLERVLSTRCLGLNADVPHNVDTTRSSVATPTVVRPSAASTVALFDLDACLGSGPEAESTPYNDGSGYKIPRSLLFSKDVNTNARPRRPSVVYIKSADTEGPLHNLSTTTPRFARWSSRAARLKPSPNSHPLSSTKTGFPRGGPRPLSLLEDRDTNAALTSINSGTPFVAAGKKQRRVMLASNDENATADCDSKTGDLKPLRFVRSETTKMRGCLRPDVVVRRANIRP